MKPDHPRIVWLSWLPLIVIPCVLLAVSTTTLAQPQPQSIGPAAPVLDDPPADQTVHLAHPANTSLTFTWQPGTGGLTPTRYQLCVTEEQRSCTDAGAWIFPFTGQPAITGTTYTARLPATFQGKRLHWTVAACAPFPSPLGRRELCTYAMPRLLIWALPAPHLGTPADNTNTSLRPTLTIRENVPGADRYLVCLAKPGMECPAQPTVTPDVIVAEVRGALQYTPPRDLAQYRNQTMQWTAAACNASRCVYQTPRHVTLLETSQVVCTDRANEVQVQNGRYVASIPKMNGSFTVRRLLPNGGEEQEPAAADDAITLQLGTSPSSLTDASLTNWQVTVECYSFYARVKVQGSLMTSPRERLQVTKTYEFTRSSNIYEQLALRFLRDPDDEPEAEGPLPHDRDRRPHGDGEPHRARQRFSIPLRELTWQLSVPDLQRVSVVATTDDFVVGYPTLGSSHPGVSGTVLPCLPQPACKEPTRSINVSPVTNLTLRQVLLANRAISINADTEGSVLTCRGEPQFSICYLPHTEFYPGFGIRVSDEQKITHEFNNWDAFKPAMENPAPIPLDETSRQTEDWLIRLTMFVVERLAQDQGWWKYHEWDQYPRGDRFTDDARSFPALAYVWAYLTMRRTPQGWTHVPGDADGIYRQLQQTYSWYLESDPSVTSITPKPAHNFADRSPFGTPYLAYSQHLKERYGPDSSATVKGVINAHSTALHWAWLMAEASHLYGDPVREAEWRAVLSRYHDGSKEMFDRAYPAHRLDDPNHPYFGLIPYERDQRDSMDAQKINYVGITFNGIAAGYLDSGTYEPEFADVVERASRQNTNPFDVEERDSRRDSDPSYDPVNALSKAPYAARLARVFPAALAFARSLEHNEGSCLPPPYDRQYWGPDMSRDLSTASLTEVLSYDRKRYEGWTLYPYPPHNPTKFISEGNGRKWILTNTQFISYWSPGFWEEIDGRHVPANMQFDIRVTLPPPPRSCVGEHYSAYRMGNKIFIMTDYTGGTLTLELPGSQLPRGIGQLSIKRRTYNGNTGRWASEQLATGVAISPGPSGKVLVQLQQVERKALTIVEIQP